MKTYALSGVIRSVVGRKVKNLRKVGQVPASVYGKKVKSQSISVALADFQKVYKQTGNTGLIDLSVDGSTKPVLVHTVQKDPVSDHILHIEFHKVDLKVKVHAKVTLELFGDSPAVTQKIGVLLTITDEVEVEALPGDLPEKLIVPVSSLSQVNDELRVKDLKVPNGVTILTDEDVTIVKVAALVSRKAEAEMAAEAASAQSQAVTPGEVEEVEKKTPEEDQKQKGRVPQGDMPEDKGTS